MRELLDRIKKTQKALQSHSQDWCARQKVISSCWLGVFKVGSAEDLACFIEEGELPFRKEEALAAVEMMLVYRVHSDSQENPLIYRQFCQLLNLSQVLFHLQNFLEQAQVPLDFRGLRSAGVMAENILREWEFVDVSENIVQRYARRFQESKDVYEDARLNMTLKLSTLRFDQRLETFQIFIAEFASLLSTGEALEPDTRLFKFFLPASPWQQLMNKIAAVFLDSSHASTVGELMSQANLRWFGERYQEQQTHFFASSEQQINALCTLAEKNMSSVEEILDRARVEVSGMEEAWSAETTIVNAHNPNVLKGVPLIYQLRF